MKKILFAVMLISNCLFGQQIEIKWGNSGQAYMGGDFALLDVKGIDAIESKFNAQSALNRGIRMNSSGLEGFILTKGHVYYPILDISSNKQKLYLQEIDHQGRLKGTYKPVTDDNYEIVHLLSAKYDYLNDIDGLVASTNGEKLLRVTSAGLAIQKIPQKLSLTVIDENAKVIWSKVQEFPNYLDPDFALNDFIVTDDGKVVLSAIITNKPKNKKGDPTYSLKVFIVTKTNLVESDVPLSADKNPILAKLRCDDEQVMVAGFYRNASNATEGNYNGSYVAGVNMKNGEVTNSASYPFDEKIYGDHTTQKQIEAGIQGIKITDLLKSGPGNYCLVACYGGVIGGVIATGGQGGGPYVSSYNFSNLLAIGYNGSAKKTFESIIGASFSTSIKNYPPRCFMAGNKILVLSSDGYRGSKGYAVRATLLDESGKILSNEQLPLQYKGLEMDPDWVRQLDANSVIINIRSFSAIGKRSYTDFKEGLLKVTPEQKTR